MKIAHKYIMAEIAGPFLLGLSAFTLVILLHRFTRLTDLVVAKGVPAALVGRLVLSLFPTFLAITLPAALLLAVLLALGRLAADSETTALHAAGIGMRGVALPVVLSSFLVFLVSLAVAWGGIPWGFRELNATVARILAVRAGAGATEHVFQEVAPGVLLFPDRVSADGTTMRGVLLSQRIEGREPLLVVARQGAFAPGDAETGVALLLSAGAIHHEDTAAGTYRVADFERMELRLPKAVAAGGGKDDPRGLTLPQLVRRAASSSDPADASRTLYSLHKRLAFAFSGLAFGLLAIPLGLSQRARGKSPALALTLVVILLYYLFISAATSVRDVSPVLMVALLWLPNVLGTLVALRILWVSERRTVALPSFLGRLTRQP